MSVDCRSRLRHDARRVVRAHPIRVACCLGVAACGRVGFEPAAAVIGDAGQPGDPPSEIACADQDLGSATGPSIATGSTRGKANNYTGCGGDGNDVTLGWTAPAAGRYVVDLCASDQFWDSVLSVRDGSCTGAQLACSDDACGGFAGLQGRVTLTLTAGQHVVIVVDSVDPSDDGNYQLSITPQ